jgi:hypothetical protein
MEHCEAITEDSEMETRLPTHLRKRRRLPSFFKDIRRTEKVVPSHIVSQIRRYETEEFKFIRGFGNKYIISSFGNVISLFHKKITFRKAFGADFTYNHVVIYSNTMARGFDIHRLVALHFVHNPHPLLYNCVNHIIPDYTLNFADNLEWCTQKQNIHYAMSLNRYSLGSKRPNAKLTEANVLIIRKSKATCQALGKHYKVNAGIISGIKRRLRWKHV